MRVAVLIAVLFVLSIPPASQAQGGSNRTDAWRAIHAVFGQYGDQAWRVSGCETGGTYSVYARNGQYLGMFQMGSNERATYGHSWDAWGQARAAYRYFVASGKDWSPWTCKP